MSDMKDDYGSYSGIGFLLAMLVCLYIALFGVGCAATPHHPAGQSWDQANLKQNDFGCPTAIFVAPNGELTQCQAVSAPPKAIAAPVLYKTMEDAAIAGLKAIAAEPTSSYWEFGGTIVQIKEGGYLVLPANTSMSGDSVGIASEEMAGFFGKEVATFHTHPCVPGHYVQYFSPDDLVHAIFFHQVVFMGDLCTGNVHEFKPGDKPDAENPAAGDNRNIWLTKGRIVGTFTAPRTMVVIG